MASVGVRAPAAPASQGRFRALDVRDFRRLWLSTVSLGMGQQMEVMVLGWYVLQRTNSPALVGLVGAARWGGMLFAPFSGVLADRMSRRTLLLAVQTVSLLGSATIAALALRGSLNIGWLAAAVLVGGLARAFDQTTRQTLIGDLVDGDRLTGAVALVQMAMNGSAIVAPLIAGRLFGLAGVGGCYTLISVLTLCSLLATAEIRPIPVVVGNTEHSPLRSMINGAGYVRRSPVVAALLWIAAIANLCPFPLTFTMMPSFARDILGVGAAGLSLLLAAAGAGTLAGNLALGSLTTVRRRGLVVIGATLAWMAVVALFAVSHWYALSLVLLVLFGMCQAISLSLVAVLLLGTTPTELRGRVMSVRMFAIATLPLGAVVAGRMIEQIGAPGTALAFAATGAVLTLAVAVGVPGLVREH